MNVLCLNISQSQYAEMLLFYATYRNPYRSLKFYLFEIYDHIKINNTHIRTIPFNVRNPLIFKWVYHAMCVFRIFLYIIWCMNLFAKRNSIARPEPAHLQSLSQFILPISENSALTSIHTIPSIPQYVLRGCDVGDVSSFV